jgi:hypothetical protein
MVELMPTDLHLFIRAWWAAEVSPTETRTHPDDFTLKKSDF